MAESTRPLAVLLAACVVLVSATPPAASAAAGSRGGTAVEFDADEVIYRVAVADDGTATWTVEYRIELTDENDTEAFESVRSEIESDPAPYRERFRSLIEPAVRTAEEETGREMAVRNLSVSAYRELGPRTGVVTYTFTWTNFAVTDGDTLRVGDALSGFYVGENTSLLFGWPASHRLADVTPEPDETRERAVVWHGRTAFADSEPRLVLAPARDGTTEGADATGMPGVPLLPVTGVGLAALLLLGALVVYGRRGTGDADPPAAPAPGAGDADPPPELLSNEERVRRALAEHGGRLKQQELADVLDWTDPKTSRVVNSLREDGAVEVFRLGRENVVSLPNDDD